MEELIQDVQLVGDKQIRQRVGQGVQVLLRG